MSWRCGKCRYWSWGRCRVVVAVEVGVLVGDGVEVGVAVCVGVGVSVGVAVTYARTFACSCLRRGMKIENSEIKTSSPSISAHKLIA